MLSQTARISTLGLEIGLSIAIGVFGGRYLDHRWGTAPVFFWIGFGLGMMAAVKTIWYAVRKARKLFNDNESSSDKKD